MCGIVGILNTDGSPVQRSVLEEMTASITHRGPSGGGTFMSGPLGLGNRRLAIIDLEGGKQPLSNENGRIWITYNGEIYNYKELQAELIARGHVFCTNSDTEVVVHAYETWGKHCVEHFRGMFAFALADLDQGQMFLARDQLGIKPLFYISTPEYFAFASEIQALLCIPNFPLDIDIEALDQYLFLQYIPAPKTIFQNVHKLKPAHRMTVSLDGSVLEPEEFWDLDFEPDHSKTESEWVEEAEAVIKDSVRAHLVSDVPFGAFLSGGIDSSCVVAYMSQILDKPVKTFTIGFEEEEFNETKYAEIVAKRWNTDHHVEILKPDALGILPELVKHYGEPYGDSSAVPTYYVSQLASRHVPMVLSGDGGDELFAGYGTYQGWVGLLSGQRPLWKKFGRRFAEILLPERYPPRQVNLATWLHIIKYLSFGARKKLWRAEYRSKCNPSVAEFEEFFKRTENLDLCSKVQYMDLKTYLPYDILTKVDIASMKHSLEARTPLVDIRVAEFAATIPQEMNIVFNKAGEHYGKMMLKKVMHKYYPDAFLNRPKMGFAIPISKWFSQGGQLNQTVKELLLGSDSKILPYFEPKEVHELIIQNQFGPVWLLLFMNEWLRQLVSK